MHFAFDSAYTFKAADDYFFRRAAEVLKASGQKKSLFVTMFPGVLTYLSCIIKIQS